jgi:glutaredoxin 3
MYSSAWCGYCMRARTLLGEKGVAFEEIDVDATPAARAQMIERSGGCSTVPQIFINDRHIGGAEELEALDATGGLDPLLK